MNEGFKSPFRHPALGSSIGKSSSQWAWKPGGFTGGSKGTKTPLSKNMLTDVLFPHPRAEVADWRRPGALTGLLGLPPWGPLACTGLLLQSSCSVSAKGKTTIVRTWETWASLKVWLSPLCPASAHKQVKDHNCCHTSGKSETSSEIQL